MKILLLEPYFTGSHKQWGLALKDHSRFEIDILSLPGRNWKWRMHGAAITMSNAFNNSKTKYDLIVAGDMLDLSVFLSLTRKKSYKIPTMVYFHENQLSYPISAQDTDIIQQRDNHYGFINYTTALCADKVVFNSVFHQKVFLQDLEKFLCNFPDYREEENTTRILRKSSVLHVGVDLPKKTNSVQKNVLPHILWNHRWQHDKNPDEFVRLMKAIRQSGRKFKLIILGNEHDSNAMGFQLFIDEFKDDIVKVGYCDNRNEYFDWLWKADLLPVCSNHDFFGVSTIEAIHCNVFPFLPNRLVYPEHITEDLQSHHLYNNFDDLLNRICNRIDSHPKSGSAVLQPDVSKYSWKNMIGKYDALFEEMKSK